MNDDRFANWTHGTESTYANGCRCDPCTWAWAEASRVRRGTKERDDLLPAPMWFDEWAASAGSL